VKLRARRNSVTFSKPESYTINIAPAPVDLITCERPIEEASGIIRHTPLCHAGRFFRTKTTPQMKKIQLAVFLALAGTGLYTQTAHAQFTYDSADGDILIGFRSTSSSVTTDYVIDIGHTLFADAAATGSVNIGTFGTDLAKMDPNWFTDGSTKWGVFGGAQDADADGGTLYAGIADTAAHSPYTVGTLPSSYASRGSSDQTGTESLFFTVGGNAENNTVKSSTPTVGSTGSTYVLPTQVQLQVAGSASGTNPSYFGQLLQTPGQAFSQFVGFEGTVNDPFGSHLDFFQINPTDDAGGPTPNMYEGTFSITSDGTINFSTTPVPEPSVLTALAGGLGLLCFIRRRRSVMA